MPEPPRSPSFTSAASSTRPTILHRPDLSHPRALSRSSSWSAWVPGSISQKLTPKRQTSGATKREKVSLAGRLKPSFKTEKGRKGSLRTPGSISRRKKSVTIEEPNDKVDVEVTSEAGTVRRGPRYGVSSPEAVENTGNSHADTAVYDANGYDARGVGECLGAERGLGIANPPGPEYQRTVEGEHYRPGHPKRQTRTVSRDDYLTGRGANPRTGLVSPSISASQSDISMPHLHQPASSAPDKKWRLKGDQWVSLDTHDQTPLPTPPTDEDAAKPMLISPREQAQAYIGQISKSGVPLATLEDRFVVNMPSAKEPCPPTMTPLQIIDFQRAIERVYRHNEEMIDPETPPTPRAVTPEGRSTPPKKLLKKNPLSFLKKRNSNPTKRKHAPAAATPAQMSGNNADAENPDSRQVNFAHDEANQQSNRTKTPEVPFLEGANATVGFQAINLLQSPRGCLRPTFQEQSTPPELLCRNENRPKQMRISAANAVSAVTRRPRSDSLQERRLMKHIPLSTHEKPVKLLSLDEGREHVSSAITTTTTTSTDTTIITPGQKQIEQSIASEEGSALAYPILPQKREDSQAACPGVSAEGTGATTVGVETVPGVANENIFQSTPSEKAIIPRGGRGIIDLGGYTLTLETQSPGIKRIGVDPRLYPDLLAPCLWLLVLVLECLLTLAIYCLKGGIWLCIRTRENWLEYISIPGK